MENEIIAAIPEINWVLVIDIGLITNVCLLAMNVFLFLKLHSKK